MARGNWQAVHLVRSTRRVCCVDAGSLAALGCCVAAAEYVRGAWVSCCRETRRACLSRIIDKCSRATRFVPPPVRWWGGTQGKRGRRAAREMRPRKARVCIAPADAACGRPHRVQLRDQKGRLPARLTRLSTRRALGSNAVRAFLAAHGMRAHERMWEDGANQRKALGTITGTARTLLTQKRHQAPDSLGSSSSRTSQTRRTR